MLVIWTTASASAQDVSVSEAIQELICSPKYTWSCDKALSIAKCESHFDPRAYASSNYGVFQINAIHIDMVPTHVVTDLYDAETNIDIAYRLYQAQGWQPWIACGG